MSKKKNIEQYEIGVNSYLTIFHQSPISTQIFNLDGYTIMANKAWEELWGAKKEEIINKYNILKDQQLTETGIMPFVKRAYKGEVVQTPAIKYIPEKTMPNVPSVDYRWVSAIMYPIKDTKGKVTNLVIQHQDITDLKNSEEKIKISEERLRLALNAGDIGVWDWDIENNLLTWTDQVYKIHRVSKANFKPTVKNLLDLIYKEDREVVKEAIDQSLNNRTPYEINFRINTKDGQIRWVSTRAVVFCDSHGKPTRMLGATSDVTKQKQLEQEKNDFLSMASHELKTPITSLKLFIDLLCREASKSDSEKIVTYAKRIQDQANRLMELTNDLLDVSKVETGKLLLKKVIFNLNDFIKDIVADLQPTATKHKVIIKDIPNIKIFADRYRIYQVLVNLITNAIKYSEDGKIIISAIKKEKEVIISVQDFGLGIPKHQQNKIFERLYQAKDSGQSKTYPGLGLGLYISKEIILRHGGRIWVESKKGKGSTFFFSLPLER